jgi:glycosyltransferase involved in cell wall biosynthesis
MATQHSLTQQGLLLVLQLPFRQQGDCLLIESQAANGLERWADNFGSVTLVAPVIRESDTVDHAQGSTVWQDTAQLTGVDRFQFVPLPRANKFVKFIRHYPAVRTRLGDLIDRHYYLQFGMGSLIGDWATVAAWEAMKRQRDYAIHADWVEHELYLKGSKGAKLESRIKAHIMSPIIAASSRWIIQHAKLGLWHGADCYAAYSPYCRNSFSIHNIHTKPADLIDKAALAAKVEQCEAGSELRVCYAGRMAAMKAPIDWVKAVAQARDLGVNLRATWIGEGDLRSEMEAAIQAHNLESVIELLGFERDRQIVMQRIRDAHVMLFTHTTAESPRCLIEALVNGTPIVGYESHYAHELIARRGGGALVPLGDWQQLGKLLQSLALDRPRLAAMTQAAAASGSGFTDAGVFQYRSELIKKHLNQPAILPLPALKLPEYTQDRVQQTSS